MTNSHAQFTCKCMLHSFLLVMVAFQALADQLNPCESIIWCLTTAARNFDQPVLAKIYRDYAIVEAWLSFHDVANYSAEHVSILTRTVSEARVLEYLEPLQAHDCHQAL